MISIQMASYQYGFTRTPYSPQADLVSAYKKANWKRILETPNVKLRLIDEARSQEVDNFYKVFDLKFYFMVYFTSTSN